MEIVLKKFDESHIDGMVKIWNDVVMDGIAFPQEETLDYNSVKNFSTVSPIVVWQLIKKPMKLWECIFFILII